MNSMASEIISLHSFPRRSKKTSKLRVTGLCAGNSPGIPRTNGQWRRKYFQLMTSSWIRTANGTSFSIGDHWQSIAWEPGAGWWVFGTFYQISALRCHLFPPWPARHIWWNRLDVKKHTFHWTIIVHYSAPPHEHHGVSYHRHLNCLLSRLFRHTRKH